MSDKNLDDMLQRKPIDILCSAIKHLWNSYDYVTPESVDLTAIRVLELAQERLIPNKVIEMTVKVQSCGCCEQGCTCRKHADPSRGIMPKICGVHQLVHHPRVTGAQRVWLENDIPPYRFLEI